MITGGKRWRRYEISAIAPAYRWPRSRATGYPDKALFTLAQRAIALKRPRQAEQLACSCDIGGAITIGEQSIVADTVEALGQHVHQKAPNELVGWQRHGLVSARSLDPVILDAGLVDGDQPAVGDG